jgi:hypothetical protein
MNLLKIVVNYLMLELNFPLEKKQQQRIILILYYLIKYIRILRICLKLLRNSIIIKQFANASIDNRIFSTGFNIGSG